MTHHGFTLEQIDQALADMMQNPSNVGSDYSDIDINAYFVSDFEVDFEQEQRL